MNREIKFRVWLKHPITEEYQIKLLSRCSLAYVTENDTFPDRIIMQFTGYPDKNSNEIFESDLVKAFNKSYDDGESINTVVFDKGCWKLRCKGKNDIPLFNYKTSELEIIGNIYQNPELLK